MAIAAGIDLLLYVDLPDAPDVLVDHVLSRVSRGEISEERVLDSARRIISMQLAAAR